MDFDGHTSDVVAAAVALVNALTPGHAHGRPWPPPEHDRLAAAEEALALDARSHRRPVPPGELDELADQAHGLRRVFELVDEDGLDPACKHANAMLEQSRAVPVLSRHDGEPWHLHFHAVDAPFARAWAAAMVTALAVVLGNGFGERLGVCSAANCDRVYVDTSRNGTRRFCSTTCQNRVKTAAFRERRATSDQ